MENASIPEHSAHFMSAMSGGEPFLEGPYLFVAAEDWLLAVGYPLDHEYQADEFKAAPVSGPATHPGTRLLGHLPGPA